MSMIECDLKKSDYTVDYEGGPEATIHFLARTHGGTRVHIYSSEPSPYFYVPMEDFGSDLDRKSVV